LTGKFENKKGVENLVVDHLFRIPNAPTHKTPINEDFLDEDILGIFKEPWYANIVNYLTTGQVASE